MCKRRPAFIHPKLVKLVEYTTKIFPTKCGVEWLQEYIIVVANRFHNSPTYIKIQYNRSTKRQDKNKEREGHGS